MARVSKLGIEDVLTGIVKVVPDDEVLDLTTEEGKEKQENQVKNKQALEDLLLAIDTSKAKGKITFQVVRGCKTDKFKKGDAELA